MDNDERENKFRTKLKRYGQVSTTMAGLAATLAGEKYLGRAIERDDHAQQLKSVLGDLKGPLMKVGQILATIPELCLQNMRMRSKNYSPTRRQWGQRLFAAG